MMNIKIFLMTSLFFSNVIFTADKKNTSAAKKFSLLKTCFLCHKTFGPVAFYTHLLEQTKFSK